MVAGCRRSHAGTAAGGAGMIEITILEKAGGRLTKKIKLDDNGKLISDGSACKMWAGVAHRVRLKNVTDDLADHIQHLTESQAIALGALEPALPDQVKVITKTRLGPVSP